MKILVLNYEYPPLGGGAGNISRHIANNLSESGHEVLVVTTWFEGLPEKEISHDRVEIIRLKCNRKFMHKSSPFEMISWMKHAKIFLAEYLLQNNFDICLANFSIPGGVVARKMKKIFDLPYCLISHGHDIPWYYKRQMFFYHLFTYFKIKSVCKNSSVNFIQTEFMKKNIDKFLGKKLSHKNIIIPNGVSVVKQNGKIIKNQPFTLLFVGRFVEQKDPITLLKALKKLSKMDIPFQTYMVGDGPMMKKIEKFIKANHLKNIHFTGWIPQEEVFEYYNKSHVIITPSRAEGMSIANLEALASGVFLIATDVSGNKEMLESNKNGILVDPGNFSEIANLLQKFYFEQYLPNKFQARNIAENFGVQNSWSAISKKYAEIFERILSEKM